MKRPIVCAAALVLTAALAGAGTASTSSATAPARASVVIRHQVHGCHAWSLNGGALHATLSTRLARGGRIVVTDNDVMPHRLILVKGPAVRFAGSPAMRHMGASVAVVFPKAGVYRLTTKAGEDYMAGVKTTGEDNVLRLTVRVS